MLFGSTPFSVNAFGAGGEVRFDVAGVASAANTNSVVTTAAASLGLTGVQATGQAGFLTIVAEANTSLDSVEATSGTSTTTVAAAATVLPLGVTAQSTAGSTTVVAKAVTGVSTPALSITVNGVTVTADAVVNPTGLAANSAAGDVTTKTQNVFTVTSAGLTVFAGTPIIAEGTFDYESIKDLYSRHRTVHLVPLQGGNTVQILPENNVVYIHKRQGSNTVYIAA